MLKSSSVISPQSEDLDEDSSPSNSFLISSFIFDLTSSICNDLGMLMTGFLSVLGLERSYLGMSYLEV